jgi:hypothetical protein
MNTSSRGISLPGWLWARERCFIWSVVSVIATVSLLFANTFIFAADEIGTKLEGKSASERADIKADAIVSKKPTGTYQNDTYGVSVEIQRVEKIEGSVQVFARAWKGGQQLGFGKDGSVEIERFRIFNPPILVEDSNGNIVRERFDESTGKSTERRLREDPAAALRTDLAHTVSVIGKVGSNIEKGKWGIRHRLFTQMETPRVRASMGWWAWLTMAAV